MDPCRCKAGVLLMSAKKRLRSNRNRHTGRINAAKRHVLDHGFEITGSDGTRYVEIDTGLVRDPLTKASVHKCTRVMDENQRRVA